MQQQSSTPTNPPLSRASVVFGLALALTALVNSVLTVVKEKFHVVLAELKQLGGHHWIAHAGIIVLLFLLTAGALALVNRGRGLSLAPGRLAQIITGSVLLSTAIIVAFYLIDG